MKYILTNKYQEITEIEGSLPNNSVLYPILIAASTTQPDANTPYKAISSGETQNFKAAENEKIYLRLFTNDDEAQFEVSVVTFIPEQIQNCSKKLPTGTILAVDYRKGVTAQDEDGKLIEPNGIETTLGHDNGVFYNTDGSFQGQRDRVRGLFAGKNTTNHWIWNDSLIHADNFHTAQISKGVTVSDITTENGWKKVTLTGVATGAYPMMFKNPATLQIPDGVILYSFGMEFKCSDPDLRLKGTGTVLQNIWGKDGDYYKFEGTPCTTGNSNFFIAIAPNDASGDGYDYTGVEIMWKEIQYEESSIATPFCEKNRGENKLSYPCKVDFTSDNGFLVKEFYGIPESTTTIPGWKKLILASTGINGPQIEITESNLQTLIGYINNNRNILIINFGTEVKTLTVNGNDVSNLVSIWKTNESLGNIAFDYYLGASTGYEGYPNNFSTKIILGKGRNLTAEEIELYSNSDIEIPDIGEFYPVAYSKKRTDENGISRNFYEVMELDDDIRAVKAGEVIKVQGADLTEYSAKIEENLAITGTGVQDVSGYIRLDAGVALPARVWVMK